MRIQADHNVDINLGEYLRKRFNELEEVRELGLPLLGGLPILKGKLKISGDIDLLAPLEDETRVKKWLSERGYNIVFHGCTLYGKIISAKRGRSIIDVIFSPFFYMHDVGDRIGPYMQVSREWDYCFVTFLWRRFFRDRLLAYIEAGIVDVDRLRETVSISPFRELIVAYADESFLKYLPGDLLNWRRGVRRFLSFIPPIFRMIRRWPLWFPCYLRTAGVKGLISNLKRILGWGI